MIISTLLPSQPIQISDFHGNTSKLKLWPHSIILKTLQHVKPLSFSIGMRLRLIKRLENPIESLWFIVYSSFFDNISIQMSVTKLVKTMGPKSRNVISLQISSSLSPTNWGIDRNLVTMRRKTKGLNLHVLQSGVKARHSEPLNTFLEGGWTTSSAIMPQSRRRISSDTKKSGGLQIRMNLV